MIGILARLIKGLRESQQRQTMRLPLLTLATLAYSTSGFLYFELTARPDLGWGDALWWSAVTMTTVGYGDIFPETIGGRYLIGFPTMIFGIGILGYLLSLVATFLVEARTKELRGMGNPDLRNHLIIVHFPGEERLRALLDQLRSDAVTRDTPIVLVDPHLEELPEAFAAELSFVRGDPTSEAVLRRASVHAASRALVLAQDVRDPDTDHHSLAAVLMLESMQPTLQSAAECVAPEHVHLFERAGCDAVVCLDQLRANLLVQEVLDPGVHQVLHQLTSNTFGQQLYLLPVSGACTYGDARRALSEQRAQAIGYRDGSGQLEINPDDGVSLAADATLVCLAATRPSL